MAFRFRLCSADGDVLGEAEYGYQPDPGDEVIIDGNRMQVRAVIRIELAGEFVDRPVYGLLEVEPLG
jgi:hypothetical protein